MSNTALIHGPLPETNYLYKNVVVKGNFPLASLLVHPDTKYTIKHNFNLEGQTIELPPNCILAIDGGMIYNGTLVGDDSILIDVNRLGNVLDNVIQTGTWKKQDVLNSLSIGTVISGDEPQVTITAEDGDAILNFVLPKGDKGDIGDPFTYEDFTEEQLSRITGPEGPRGKAFEYSDFTQELLESIRGPLGILGPKGVSILSFTKIGELGNDLIYNTTFDDGSVQTVNIPKGEKGDQGPMGDVAVITPLLQAAFTMYSTTGLNTDGPMTQKAVTDSLTGKNIVYNNIISGLNSNDILDVIDEMVINFENKNLATFNDDNSSCDLNIGDRLGNILILFEDGHVKTKNFDSRDVLNSALLKNDKSLSDLNIGDNDGNVLVEFKDGHIRTKYFDSKNIGNSLTSLEHEMIDDARIKIINLNKNKKFLNFAFITDTHAEGRYLPTIRIATDSLRLFKAICNERFVDFAVHGGDIITDYCSTRADAIKAFDSVTSYTGEIMCPIYFTKGNHDGNGKCFPRADMNNLNWNNTYYVAYASGDVIGLKTVTEQTWDGESELFTSNIADISEILTNQQFFMLTQNSIDVEHDVNNKYSGYFYKDYDDYGIRIVVINAYEIPTEVSGTGNTNYDGAGVSLAQKTWLNNVLNTDKKVIVFGHTQNPTGLALYILNKPNLIAYIHGHQHLDNYITNNTIKNNIGVINAFGTEEIERYYAFSVFTVDTENNILYETRIGTGNDREFNF